MLTHRLGKLAALACAGALAMSLAACSLGGATSATDAGITVTASSEVKVVPDKARVSLSVVTEEKDAEACRNANAKDVNAVVEALRGMGLADESIQTSYADLSPRYGSRVKEGNGKTVEVDDAEYDEWVITGYEMTTELTVSDLEIDDVGKAVEASVAAGANRSNGVEYYASNYDESYDEALGAALELARNKADSIAQATGANLGRVVKVTEGYQDTSSRYVMSENAADDIAEASSAGAAAKTMPGQIEISAEVTVTYAI